MARRRSVVHLFAFFAIISAIASRNVVEAGLFDGLIKGIMDDVKGVFSKVIKDATKKFSVFADVFGEGVSMADLSIGEVASGAFSRNNAANVENNTVDGDWKIDNNKVIGAIFKSGVGGGISVSITDGKVHFSRGSKASDQDDKNDAKPSDNKPEDVEVGNINGEPSTEPKSPLEWMDSLIEDWDAFMDSRVVWDGQNKAAEERDSESQSEEGNDEDGSEDEEPIKDEGEGIQGRTGRIVNGVFFGDALASGSRFSVKFFYNNESQFYCSGALIGYPYVLTAAHCGVVQGDTVRVGGRFVRSGYKATVAEVRTHPDFDRQLLTDDLAIVRLDGLVSKEELLENGVEAARINKPKNAPKEGDRFLISGHGSTNEGTRGVSDTLMTTRQTVYANKKCIDEIQAKGLKDDHDSYLCAGDGERSTSCFGDSGLGLWRYWARTNRKGNVRRYFEIVGIVSFGKVTDDSYCPPGAPTMYQKLSKNRKWIVDTVGKENLA